MYSVYLSCKQAAHSLKVSQSTIKRLCDEGTLSSIRTPGGHRRISLKSVQQWQLAAGHGVTEQVGPRREAGIHLDYHQCCHWLLEGQGNLLVQQLSGLHLQRSLAEIIDDVLGPALVRLGRLFQTQEISHQQTVVACQRMRGLLCRLSENVRVDKPDSQRAVGAASPGDPADLASLFAEITLRELGWNAESLGVGLSGSDLAEAALQAQASLVWVCYTHPQDASFLLEHNRTLTKMLNPEMRLVIGGGALNAPLRKQLVFNFFGDSMVHLSQYATGQTEAIEAA